MELKDVNGNSIDTNNLSDVDADLMESSKKLHEIFKKYNRQLLLIGEMKASEITTSEQGCSFFHIGQVGITPENYNAAVKKFLWRIDGFLRSMGNGELYIARTPNTPEKE